MLEENIYSYLNTQTEVLQPILAAYGQNMAIFNQEAPSDQDTGWGNETQYPRIVFACSLTADAFWGVKGQLFVDLFTSKTGLPPEYFEPLIKSLLDGVLFNDNDRIFAVRWDKSVYFTPETKPVTGVTLVFNILAYPVNESENPDTLVIFRQWLKTEYPNSLVVGLDELPSVTKPGSQPIFYIRRVKTESCDWLPSLLMYSWIAEDIVVHAMGSSDFEEILREIKIKLLWGKPPLVYEQACLNVNERKININMEADPYLKGQLSFQIAYLCRPPESTGSNLVRHIYSGGVFE